MGKKKEWISMIVGFLGAMLGLYGVVAFNQFVLMSLPLGMRMVCMPLVYWLIALIPIIATIVNKDKLVDYGRLFQSLCKLKNTDIRYVN